MPPDGFHGDVYLTVKLLLPGVIKSVYNLNDKQIVKLFSRIFNCNPDDMARDLEQVRGRGGRVAFQVGLCHAGHLQPPFSGWGTYCFWELKPI